MSDSSFIPERQLAFSPALAATIGLEEAILLQHLDELFRHREPEWRDGLAWLAVERRWLLDSLPFWDADALRRVSQSLADKGVLSLEPPGPADVFRFAVNAGRGAGGGKRDARPMRAGWSPGEDVLLALWLNNQIPRQFALEQLEEFALRWRETGGASHARENRFRQHVLGRWLRVQQSRADSPASLAPEAAKAPAAGPWRERAAQRQRIPDDFQPSEDVYDILGRSRIGREFARAQLPEFILYWKDRDEPRDSWNTLFVGHVKYRWENRQRSSPPAEYARPRDAPRAGHSPVRALLEDFADNCARGVAGGGGAAPARPERGASPRARARALEEIRKIKALLAE